MLINNVNLNQLRIFAVVFRTRSMTLASKELHLTQSGVSQHVKALEDALGVVLFDRIKQRLIPTSAAALLYQKCAEGLLGIEQALSEIKEGEKQLLGNVTIGMPVEFGNNIVVPLLSKFSLQHPGVRYGLKYGLADEINGMILNGALDFAFVDAFGALKALHSEIVYDETLQLCAHKDYLKRAGAPKENRKFLESLAYVEYQPDQPVLKMWFSHHYGVKKPSLNVLATVMDVQGVARLIFEGMGAGVLPDHLIEKLDPTGTKLHLFKGCGKPLKNGISVVSLHERTRSPAANAVQDWIVQSL